MCHNISAVRSLFLVLLLALQSGALLQSATAQASAQTQAITAAIRERDFFHAVELTRAALQQFPRDPKLWSLQGIAYSGLGKKAEALAAYNSALKFAPDYIPALEGA